jgi:hypothetical protein
LSRATFLFRSEKEGFVTDFVLALIAASFLTFGGVLSGVSIYVALAELLDRRRHQTSLAALSRQA